MTETSKIWNEVHNKNFSYFGVNLHIFSNNNRAGKQLIFCVNACFNIFTHALMHYECAVCVLVPQ